MGQAAFKLDPSSTPSGTRRVTNALRTQSFGFQGTLSTIRVLVSTEVSHIRGFHVVG